MPGDQLEIQIRDMTPEDKGGVLALCQHTPCEDDYLLGVIERPTGADSRIRVGIAPDGTIAGIHQYKHLDDRQCWLSGLRIHSSVRGRGLAQRFLEDGIALAQADGMRKLRYSSEVGNEFIHRMSEKHQLRSRGIWLAFERVIDSTGCEPEGGGAPAWGTGYCVKPQETSRLLSLLRASGRNLYVDAWTWRSLDEEALRRMTEQGRALVCWSETGGWSAAFLAATVPEEIEVTLAGSDPPCAQSLLDSIRRGACDSGVRTTITAHVPQDSPTASLLAGLAKRGELRALAERQLRLWELDLAPTEGVLGAAK